MIQIDNALVSLNSFPETLRETIKDHPDVELDGNNIVIEAQVDDDAITAAAKNADIFPEEVSIDDFDNDELEDELNERLTHKIITSPPQDMSIKDLRVLLCDRYGVNHLTDSMVLLNKLIDELT